MAKFLYYGKDGGEYSTVWGYFLIEIKSLFSIVLLKFEDGSRNAYHTHAFNCISWVLKGKLVEEQLYANTRHADVQAHKPGLKPVYTYRNTFHKVTSIGRTWVLSFRGPWSKTWKEYIPSERRNIVLTHGREEV